MVIVEDAADGDGTVGDTGRTSEEIENYVEETSKAVKDSGSESAVELAEQAEDTLDYAKTASDDGVDELAENLFESAYQDAKAARGANTAHNILVWAGTLLLVLAASVGTIVVYKWKKQKMPVHGARTAKSETVKPVYYYPKR